MEKNDRGRDGCPQRENLLRIILSVHDEREKAESGRRSGVKKNHSLFDIVAGRKH